VQGDSYHGVRSETIPQLGTILPEVEWSRFRPSWLGHSVAGAPTRAPDLGDDTLLRVVAPPRTTGSIKGRVAQPRVSFLPSFLSARSVWLGIDSPPIPLLAPPFFTNSPADSAFFTTSPPFSTYLLQTPPLSTHWLMTPPKSLPSRPTVASHSLDRR